MPAYWELTTLISLNMSQARVLKSSLINVVITLHLSLIPVTYRKCSIHLYTSLQKARDVFYQAIGTGLMVFHLLKNKRDGKVVITPMVVASESLKPVHDSIYLLCTK